MKRAIIIAMSIVAMACASAKPKPNCPSKYMSCTRLHYFCVWQDCHGTYHFGMPSKEVRKANTVDLSEMK